MKALVGKRISKTVKFMGEELTINKLTVNQVMSVQAKIKESETTEKDLDAETIEGFQLIKFIIKASVDDAAELTNEDFNSFPVDELTSLSNKIMEYSGMGNAPKS